MCTCVALGATPDASVDNLLNWLDEVATGIYSTVVFDGLNQRVKETFYHISVQETSFRITLHHKLQAWEI